MAAGKHGGFRDNEFRDREYLIDASSRRVFNGGRKEYDRARNGNLDLRRGRSQDERGRVNTSLKDDRKREGVNRGYRSSLSRHYPGSAGVSNHCPRRGGFSFRTVEREPGELSNNVNGSNDRVESGLQVKGNEMSNKMEEGIQPPLERKRKFSPIVCDIDDKEVSISSNCEGDGISMMQPLQPSLAQVYLHSSKAAPHGGISASFSSKSNDDCLSSLVIAKSPPSSGSNGITNYNSLVNWPSGSPNQQSQSFMEVEHGSKEEYSTRRILSSRWVTGPGSTSPDDEGEILDDEGEILDDEAMLEIQKNVSLFESLETRWHRISSSPDAKRNSHEVADVPRQKSCVSVQSSIADDYHSDDLGNKNEDIEMDLENERKNTSVSWSGSNSDEESDFNMLPEPLTSPQRSIDMLQHCRSLDEYEKLNKINEGTYGVVYRARDKKTGEIVALKKVKMEKEREGFPLTSLREINILLSFHHPSIVDVKEVVMGNDLDSIFMVMEYMEHDLKGLMETMKQPFSQSEVKCLMLQLLEGVKYLHDNWVLHRDLKTSNLLLNNQGELKICDFGLARQYGSPLKTYTQLVVTLWYRAPELLLGSKKYSTAIDMWSLGCIMAELLSKEPLFNGKTEIDQLDKIFKTLGTPNETIWPGFSELPGVRVNFVKHRYNLLRQRFPVRSFIGSPVLSESGFDLLNKLLTYDPEKRITVDDALNHEWFCEVPLPKSREFMPTFPSQNTQNRCMRRILKSPDPLEEQRKKEMQQGELGTLGLFGQER